MRKNIAGWWDSLHECDRIAIWIFVVIYAFTIIGFTLDKFGIYDTSERLISTLSDLHYVLTAKVDVPCWSLIVYLTALPFGIALREHLASRRSRMIFTGQAKITAKLEHYLKRLNFGPDSKDIHHIKFESIEYAEDLPAASVRRHIRQTAAKIGYLKVFDIDEKSFKLSKLPGKSLAYYIFYKQHLTKKRK
jgi:hypothetical protein